MRFDLEIPSTNIDLVYIPEGNKIPIGIIPLDYVHMNHKKYMPSDFISIEENVLVEDFAGEGANEQVGPNFIAKGNRFRITHVAKYSTIQNTKIPLFWKHTIKNKIDERINEDTIKVVDFYGVELSQEQYLIEQNLDSKSQQYITTVYINKHDSVLFVEYVSNDTIHKKLISFSPIFSEVGWETMIFSEGDIPSFMYMFQGNEIKTSYLGTMWIEYEHEKRPIRKPIANIDEPWYVGILNAEWTIGLNNYSVPEYYMQHSTEQSQYTIVKNKKCKHIFGQYIQTQYPIDIKRGHLIEVFIKDYFTGEIKAAITTDTTRKGDLYNSLVFQLSEDFNSDGIIKLPVTLTENDVVYATYPIYDNYYEFRFFNFNSDNMNSGGHVAFYVKPNVKEAEFAVYYAMIGDRIPKVGQTFGLQGLVFETTNDYFDFIAEKECYHLSTIKISARQEAEIVEITDVRKVGGELIDKKIACELTSDMFYHDIINGNIVIPTNDVLIAHISSKDLVAAKLIKHNGNTDIDEDSFNKLQAIHSTIAKNLDLSTKAILLLDIPSAIKLIS